MTVEHNCDNCKFKHTETCETCSRHYSDNYATDTNETGKRIVDKTVKSAWIDGDDVIIKFTDGTVFHYYPSDAGYSSWDITSSFT